MLLLTPQQRLLLGVVPLDFRKGINTITALVANNLLEEPDDGTLFIFTNRSKTAVKILVYDGQGYWLCMKRFSSGKLKWWPKSSNSVYSIGAKELQVLLYQGNPAKADIKADWRPINLSC